MKLPGVAKTALLVAAMRAEETDRSEEDGRLFVDPFAHRLAGAEGLDFYAAVRKELGEQPATAIRTWFLDERINRALANGFRQIVILAAGMDSRAFRLDLPKGTQIFELDQSHVLEYKNKILENSKAKGDRHCIAVDLREDWVTALAESGFNPNASTVWLVEGLLMYLQESHINKLFDGIHKISTKGDILLCDILGRTLLEAPFMQKQMEYLKKIGAPWIFGTDEPENFLAKWNWEAKAYQAGELAPNRWPFPVAPRHIPNVPRGFFLEAKKL